MFESTEITGQKGVFAVGKAVTDLGWDFRLHSSPEYGIDGEIEVVHGNQRSGKILKVQIKSGPHWFKERTSSAFIYRGDQEHLSYWLRYAVPVLIVLYNPATNLTYWESIDKEK